MLKQAILFLIFNRYDTAIKVFAKIKEAKPYRLYIASDGARTGITEEKALVEKVRSYILENIDWECKVSTLFRNTNMGCKYAVSSAIDWFFENEEQGIILEDDCVPSQSFFEYCHLLLEKYKCHENVMQINGYLPFPFKTSNSYIFSKYGTIWGWASWKRAWKHYDVEMKAWSNMRNDKNFDYFYQNEKEKEWRMKIFDKIANNEIDTWDYQWAFAKLYHKGISIFPNCNLIENIGFDQFATHTRKKPKKLANMHELELPLKHPDEIKINPAFDEIYLKSILSKSLFSNLFEYLKRGFHA
jgi:hypothetical protein